MRALGFVLLLACLALGQEPVATLDELKVDPLNVEKLKRTFADKGEAEARLELATTIRNAKVAAAEADQDVISTEECARLGIAAGDKAKLCDFDLVHWVVKRKAPPPAEGEKK